MAGETDLIGPPPLIWSAASRCGVRHDVNEDAFLASPERGLFCVADGMGGHLEGQLASLSVARILDRMVAVAPLEDCVDTIERSLQRINASLRSEAVKSGASAIIGATVVVLVMDRDYAVVSWAGDSRCYLMRDGELFQITRDHGVPQNQETRRTNVVSRAVGSGERIELDRVVLAIEPEDTFLLCSDGISDYLEPDDILAGLQRPLESAAEDLVEAAAVCGSRDDLTAVLARVAG
ncbi:PP2C family protein-serine/threonine phosphatase [Amorphus orientalis]|uniref:Serine/threonine protein phosphatase PrpC n=1 Tax=Amorphus orientalis TaxID=649198 RepID=A0AAE3VMA9_9HYPH|nr:PP2C family serine/threonine-protein phosphatase [Amorphus orientalis]MDQ0314301.1 serine/threonine protein phosphatase PrpC [Amorphus orientalis]